MNISIFQIFSNKNRVVRELSKYFMYNVNILLKKGGLYGELSFHSFRKNRRDFIR